MVLKVILKNGFGVELGKQKLCVSKTDRAFVI